MMLNDAESKFRFETLNRLMLRGQSTKHTGRHDLFTR